MDRAAIGGLIDITVAALERGEPVDPWSLTFLLRCYVATDRADIREALEPGLAQALQLQAAAGTTGERAAWLVPLSDALAVSADDRLRDAAAGLVAALRSGWGRSADVIGGAASVGACLRASRSMNPGEIVQDAIDELERLVAGAYRPGAALTHQGTGSLAAPVALASALLIAYDVSGRLPYSMLAEELMQSARRTLWDEGAACFADARLSPADCSFVNCEAALVLCGIAALHAEEGYRAAAVIRPDATCADDAGRILIAQESAAREPGACRGAYGLALHEWLSLRRD